MKKYIQPVCLLTEFHTDGTLLNASMEFGSEIIDIGGQESRRRWYFNTWVDYDDSEEDENEF